MNEEMSTPRVLPTTYVEGARATICAPIFKERSDCENGSALGVNLYRRLSYFDPQGMNEERNGSDYSEFRSESAPFLGQIPGRNSLQRAVK